MHEDLKKNIQLDFHKKTQQNNGHNELEDHKVKREEDSLSKMRLYQLRELDKQ